MTNSPYCALVLSEIIVPPNESSISILETIGLNDTLIEVSLLGIMKLGSLITLSLTLISLTL